MISGASGSMRRVSRVSRIVAGWRPHPARQTVAATENAVETGMISIPHEHIEAWYADIATSAAIKTSTGK